MYICRLFERGRPFEQVDARVISDGIVSVGRDPDADWHLADAEGTLSRIHCTLSVENGQLMLCDRSTNGTFLDDGTRVPKDTPVSVTAHQTLHLGGLRILVDQTKDEPLAHGGTGTIIHLPLPSTPPPVAAGWTDAPLDRPVAPHRDASLIEAFCEGADLDASSLTGEDPVELMKRLGAVYQQTVLGLAALLAERTRLKAEFELERTTIAAMDNNPFKWAPTRRLANDLLCSRSDGFLTGGDAVRASFVDVGEHLAGAGAGGNAAVSTVLHLLSPEVIAASSTQGFSLRGRAALCWDAFSARHRELTQDAQSNGGPIAEAFRAGYLSASDAKLGR